MFSNQIFDLWISPVSGSSGALPNASLESAVLRFLHGLPLFSHGQGVLLKTFFFFGVGPIPSHTPFLHPEDSFVLISSRIIA